MEVRQKKSSVCAIFLACAVLLLAACQKDITRVQERVSPVPHFARVATIPFTQPLTVGALVQGSLPQHQGRITPEELQNLDLMLESALLQKQRFVTRLPLPSTWAKAAYIHEPHAAATKYWLAYGKKHNVDLLLVPQVIIWQQRHGGRAGVSESAHVRTELFLLDVRVGRIYSRSLFEEKQVGLLEDISKAEAFFNRGGSWVRAEELAQEAITKAIQDLGL